MNIKDGASIKGCRWQMFHAALVVETVLKRYGHECVITAGTDGQHGPNTFHVWGLALDLRKRDVPVGQRPRITKDLKQELGSDYDVVEETDHWHVEVSNKWIADNGDPRKAA